MLYQTANDFEKKNTFSLSTKDWDRSAIFFWNVKRDEQLEQIYIIPPQVKNLDVIHKFIYMMSAGGLIIKLVSHFASGYIR